MNTNKELFTSSAGTYIRPYAIRRALVGLEMGDTDESLLEYMRFFKNNIPVSACKFLHVLPGFNLYEGLFKNKATQFVGHYSVREDYTKNMANLIYSKIKPGDGVSVDYEVKEGNPLEELLKEAESMAADLVIIGQKAHVNSHGILARNIARKSKCDTLVVPTQSIPQLQSIIVPVDFSTHSAKALQTAVSINKQLDKPVKIIAVNVYPLPDLKAYKTTKTADQIKQMIASDRQAAIKAFINTSVREGCEYINCHLISQGTKSIAEHLVDFTEQNHINLTVIGAIGHSQIERMFLGSVTESLLTISSTPTLIVK